jgi:hypothetical protein
MYVTVDTVCDTEHNVCNWTQSVESVGTMYVTVNTMYV